MNKTDLIRRVSKATGFTIDNSTIAVEAVIGCFTNAMECCEKIMIQDLFSMTPVEKPARVYKNPQNGEPVNTPAKRTYKFRIADSLKKSINRDIVR